MTRVRARICGGIAALAFSLAAAKAHAGSCVFNEIVPVAFGPYNPFSGTPGSATGWVVYQCSLVNILDRVTIDLSVGSSGAYTPWRTLLSDVGNHPLQYNLYKDPGFTQIFGDGSGSTFHHGPQGLPVIPTKVFIYGYMPPSQNAWTGSYNDLIVVTMSF